MPGSWFYRRVRPDGDAPALVCLPHAGGGVRLYRTWQAALEGLAEVVPVHLPGREARISEPPIDRMADLVPRLIEGLGPLLDRPVALFGHSMGGMTAFAVAHAIEQRGLPSPAHVFVSGCSPTGVPGSPRLHDLDRPALFAELRAMGGTPEEFFHDEELIELVLPALRADLALAEGWIPGPEEQLDAPITAFAATDDATAPPLLAGGWRRHTRGAFSLHETTGGHFFVYDDTAVLPTVAEVLRTGRRPLS